ncbi:MAG: hypothetical protein Q9227_003762 [Pyrenula ochraceoflavens]
MAAATKNIGFGVTSSTTYEQPFHLARRLSTVDHLTKGRLAWNIVTSYLDSAARNLGRTEQMDHDDRQLAQERFGRDPSKIKFLALVTPILGQTEEQAQAKLKDYQKYASHEGALALFGGWTGIDLNQYGDAEELQHVESNAVRSTVEGYARFSPANTKWTKHTVAEHVSIGGNGPVLVGTPARVADGLETWVNEAGVDGFNLAYVLFPRSFKDIVQLLLPELRRRGLFWENYAVPGGTYRENFYGKEGAKHPPDDHIASKYHWKAGVKADGHHIPA